MTDIGRSLSHGSPERKDARCIGGDSSCPCQDGDICHYVATPGSPAMTPAPDLLKALRIAIADSCGGCGECFPCETLNRVEVAS